MSENLHRIIKNIVQNDANSPQKTRSAFLNLLTRKKILRSDNATSHFCSYFVPFYEKMQKLIIVHHKNSDLWLVPGGHIEKNETPKDTVIRESNEELGIKVSDKDIYGPFFLSITKLEKPRPTCLLHFDIWYIIMLNSLKFQKNTEEFFDTKWISLMEVKQYIHEKNNLQAVKILKNFV